MSSSTLSSHRDDGSFLRDILTACEKIERIASADTDSASNADDLKSAAILHHLTVIGEAANRHRIVHAYFDLDWQILWDSATTDIPLLREQVLKILQSEHPC